MKLKFSLLIICATALGLLAVTTRTPEDIVPPVVPKNVADTISIPPILSVKQLLDGEVNPNLQSLKVNVETWGNMAITTLDMTFFNQNDRVLEGEMVFPLAPGQTVSRFAMEVNGVLQEGVVVEKNKGQKVFESIEREKADPGLLEYVAGNSYRARIYPIPAKGSKRIIVAYEQELLLQGDGLVYDLPLEYKVMGDELTVKVTAHQAEAKSMDHGANPIAFDFTTASGNSDALFSKTNLLINHHISFAIPFGKQQWKTVAEDEMSENKTYFFTVVKTLWQPQPKPAPKKISIYWDVSGSADSSEQVKLRALVDVYLKMYADVFVEVFPFSNEMLESRSFQIVGKDNSELLKFLVSLKSDGGTQLGCIKMANSYDEAILFTDGLSNFGKSTLDLPSIPVYCISASVNSDMNYLNHISQSTGGSCINLTQTTIENALKLMSSRAYRLLQAKVYDTYGNDSGEAVIPGMCIINGSTVTVAGYVQKGSKLFLSIGYDEYDKQQIIVPIQSNSSGGIAKRMWIQKQLSELNMQPEKNKQRIIELATANQIVTAYTSLIVLETLDDYLKYEITPSGELAEEYTKIMKERGSEKRSTDKEHMEQVVQYFKARKDWWKTEFNSVPDVAVAEVNEAENTDTTQVNRLEVVTDACDEEMKSEEDEPSLSTVEVVTGALPAMFDAMNSGVVNSTCYSLTMSGATSANIVALDKTFSVEEVYQWDMNKGKEAAIELNAWNPETPYMKTLKDAPKKDVYDLYLGMRAKYSTTPSFFIDVADYLMELGDRAHALRVLSNLAEVDIKNYRLMRILAHRLQQMKELNYSVMMFEEVEKIRSEEPQTYRDLALVLAETGREQEALVMMYKVISTTWDGRFPELECIAAGELNNIISRSTKKLDTSFIDSRLLKQMPVETRVILNWDADNCDIDLWITDPTGFKCYYASPDAPNGGHMSRDFTGGYGPEEFILKHSMKGEYIVQIHYYGDRQQSVEGPTTVQLEMYTNYGFKNQKVNKVTRRLSEPSEGLQIGSFVVE